MDKMDATLKDFLDMQQAKREEEEAYGIVEMPKEGYHVTPEGVSVKICLVLRESIVFTFFLQIRVRKDDLIDFMTGLQAELPCESTPQYATRSEICRYGRQFDSEEGRSGQERSLRTRHGGSRALRGPGRLPTSTRVKPGSSARALGMYETVTKEVRRTPSGRAVTTLFSARNGKKRLKNERQMDRSRMVNRQLAQFFRTAWHCKRGRQRSERL